MALERIEDDLGGERLLQGLDVDALWVRYPELGGDGVDDGEDPW